MLVVDDSADVRFLICMTLGRHEEFSVAAEAGDGEEAIRQAGAVQPDIVLLDLSMPVMDGLEALPGILAAAPGSKVLVLSGFNARQMAAEAIGQGASGYMEKGGIVEKLAPTMLALVPPKTRQTTLSLLSEPTEPTVADMAEGNQERQELVALLVHELQNPVTVLQGFAMTLQSAAERMSPESVQQAAEAIARGSKHLGALIQAFSDLGKIEVAALDLILEPTDLTELVRDCVADMAEITQTHPVFVEFGPTRVVELDGTRIRQVLINLLSNAAKFGLHGTRIDVKVNVTDAQVELSVRDHGPGIPAHKVPELFRKFSRLGSQAKGTGLGLYISRAIARAHGGDLVLRTSDSTGCEFVLRLPAVERHAG
ncbi:MAG: ATP-binding protein [Acidimicrobiales bacterium]